MFTGIVQAVGSVRQVEARGGDMRLVIDTADLDLSSLSPGDSIAVNGACLTAVELEPHAFAADVSLETLDKTSLGQLGQGSPVNLETALTLETALGGHLVSGHVDGLATLVEMQEDARSWQYRFEVDPSLQHYIAVKGSVTLDGTSLTVNAIEANRFDVNIVPHTQQKTIFGHYREGTRVNLEVDIIARYLERLITGRHEAAHDNRQMLQTLINSGFIDHE